MQTEIGTSIGAVSQVLSRRVIFTTVTGPIEKIQHDEKTLRKDLVQTTHKMKSYYKS